MPNATPRAPEDRLSGPASRDPSLYSRRHLRWGWSLLLLFLTLGLVLEALHGFKVAEYMNPSNSTRRLLWTLAHAHGTLLGLVNLGFVLTVPLLPAWEGRSRDLASSCLISASILMPAGFFLGGATPHAGDPGLGILAVPAGGALLLIAVALVARAAARPMSTERARRLDPARAKKAGPS